MVYNLPAHGEANWDTKLNQSIDSVKATADAAETPAGAQAKANAAQAAAVQRANHTGTQSADTITDGTTNKAYTAAEKTKLAGVATGATANSTDATLLSRANHTGTQTLATISDAGTAASKNTGTTSGTVPLLGTGGVIAPAQLGTGTPAAGKYVDGTGAWTTLPAGGGGGGPAWDPGTVTGDYVILNSFGSNVNPALNDGTGVLYLFPFRVDTAFNFDRAAVHNTAASTAGGNNRILVGIYSPGTSGTVTRTLDLGAFSTTTTGILENSGVWSLSAGYYYLGVMNDANATTLNFAGSQYAIPLPMPVHYGRTGGVTNLGGMGSAGSVFANVTAGSLPASATLVWSTGNPIRIALRRA